jgi:cation diffusion facilitator CzcD-associated flavoprotein CzcO
MKQTEFDWAVIGAGPAGIAAVGKLLDNGVSAERIAWIDPAFTVGDFGNKWRKVPSNTKVKLFLNFLMACESFRFSACENKFAIHDANPNLTCQLHLMADPLQWVTEQLKQQVQTKVGFVKHLKLIKRRWELLLENESIYAKQVVIAVGAEPKTLPLAGVETIPLNVALDTDELAKTCNANDTVAVFGSSHSAILIIRFLLESTNVKKVINFYREPLRYAVYLDNEILFDDTGLKGTTADWARDNIDGSTPHKLLRVFSSPENINKYLPECTKAVHAVGFQRRSIPIDGLDSCNYNDRSGIIAPGLFGFGIAYPEAKTDRFGTIEYRVGLWKFMDYITRLMPVWLQYSP